MYSNIEEIREVTHNCRAFCMQALRPEGTIVTSFMKFTQN